MKLTALARAAALTVLMTWLPFLSHSAATDDEVLMPEVSVTEAQPQAPHHPQDPTYSMPPVGCVEVITPSAPRSGYAFAAASRAKHGIPVIPNLNDPRAAADYWHNRPTYEQSPATPAGQEGKPGCQR